MNWRLVTQLVLLLITSTGISQTQRFRFHHFGVNEGLSQSNVSCMMQDQYGQMWFGDRSGGITVFDGFRTILFKENPGDHKSLKGDFVRGILELNENLIAIATTAGLNLYHKNRDSFSLHRIAETDQPMEILRRENQHLFIRSGQQLLCFDIQKLQFQTPPAIRKQQFGEVFGAKKSGNHYSEFLSARIFALYEDRYCSVMQLKAVFANRLVNDVLLDTNSRDLYLATHTGLFIYHLPTASCSKAILDGSIKALIRYKNNLFIGTKDSGMYIYSLTSRSFTAHYTLDTKNPESISGNYVRSFFIDRQENLWLSALQSGINYCRLKPELAGSLFSHNRTLPFTGMTPHIASICTDRLNILWVADIRGHVAALDSSYHVVRSLNPEEVDPVRKPFSIQQLFSAKSGVTYIVTDGIYYMNDRKKFSIVPNEDGSISDVSCYYMTDIDDTLALVSTGSGLFCMNTQKQRIYNRDTLIEKPKSPRYIYRDSGQNVYFKKNSQQLGVYFFRKRKLILQRSIPCKAVLNGAYETSDTIWFATSLGIMGLSKKTYEYLLLDERHEIPNDQISAIQPDPENPWIVWCASHKGIFRYNLHSRQSFKLEVHDGLSTIEFHGNSVRRNNGDMVFCSINGINWINPATMKPDNQVNELEIFGFRLNKELPNSAILREINHQYTIPYHYNSLTFRLMQINFPARVFPIRYRLLGLEKNWNTEMNPAEVNYSNLREGDYEFVAQYYNRNKGWIEKRFFKLHILPPWYRSRWAYALYLLIAACLLWFIVHTYLKIRLAQQKAILQRQQLLQEERNRISADLHDEIGATLSSINLYSEMAQQRMTSHPEQSLDMIERINHQSKELMHSMSDIIWSMKVPMDGNYTMLGKIVQYKMDLLQNAGIDLEMAIDQDIDNFLRHPLIRKNMLLIIKESFNNMSKYSLARKGYIALSVRKNQFILIIRDDGIGFDMESVKRGNGLQNIRYRTEQLRGVCSIISAKNAGCIIECHIPIASSSYEKESET